MLEFMVQQHIILKKVVHTDKSLKSLMCVFLKSHVPPVLTKHVAFLVKNYDTLFFNRANI